MYTGASAGLSQANQTKLNRMRHQITQNRKINLVKGTRGFGFSLKYVHPVRTSEGGKAKVLMTFLHLQENSHDEVAGTYVSMVIKLCIILAHTKAFYTHTLVPSIPSSHRILLSLIPTPPPAAPC